MSAPSVSVFPDLPAVASDIVVDDAALRAADLMARFGHLDGAELLRALFREVSLSPWTVLTDRVRALLGELERQGRWSTAQVVVRRDPLENDLAMFCRLLPVILRDQPRM